MDSARPPPTPTLTVTFDECIKDSDGEAKVMAANRRDSSIRTRPAFGRRTSVASMAAQSSDHRQRMKMLERYLKQHDNSSIKLAVENLQASSVTIPFALKFKVDQDRAAKRNKKRSKFSAIFQYFLYLNKKFGLSHVLLILLLIAYSLLGGAIFDAIERPQEREDLQRIHQALMGRIANFSEDILSMSLAATNESAKVAEIEQKTKNFYLDMLTIENKVVDSVFDKVDNNRYQWNFGSAIFYSTCLFTTIGYGTIVCVTPWGKTMTIIYSSIGIPLILVVLSDLGRVLLLALNTFYNYIYRLFRRTGLCRVVEENETTDRTFPLRVAIPLVVVYMLICAIIVFIFDYKSSGDEDSISFGNCFYFSFISMTTIGLGDVMPNHIQYSPFVSTLYMFGLVLFSVINSTIYSRMERNYFRAMEAMEEVLEEMHAEQVDESARGRNVFKGMSDAIRIATLTMPEVDEERGAGKAQNLSPLSDDSRRTSASSGPRHRNRDYSGSSDINSFVPTLGIFGGVKLGSLREISEVSEPHERAKPAATKTNIAKSRSDTNLFFERPRRLSQRFRRSLHSLKRVHPEL
uniref:Potassium channel domain-containing protein n=1 Tax=Plectus sambesii TaxID=2011161 RepID=A0A914WJW9_9BILA